MNIDLSVTVDVPPQRFIAVETPEEPLAAFRPGDLINYTPGEFESAPVTIVSVHSSGLSGHTIGQMLRSLAHDVEAAEQELNPPKEVRA